MNYCYNIRPQCWLTAAESNAAMKSAWMTIDDAKTGQFRCSMHSFNSKLKTVLAVSFILHITYSSSIPLKNSIAIEASACNADVHCTLYAAYVDMYISYVKATCRVGAHAIKVYIVQTENTRHLLRVP